jgi:hypothetical protein
VRSELGRCRSVKAAVEVLRLLLRCLRLLLRCDAAVNILRFYWPWLVWFTHNLTADVML